ncbi:MAG: 5'/3'-nucleotidase SurE [Synechococcus sp.]
MAFLLTNDDGIDAPGIQALWAAIEGDGTIVAPDRQWSGCGHATTTASEIEVTSRSTQQFATTGTPADCVRLGIKHLYPEARMVLSGINAGGNLGTDVYMSGTVAAVREAALQGIPGIAISQYKQANCDIDWDRSTRMAVTTIAALLQRHLPKGSFWNVNLPHIDSDRTPELIFCPPCKQPLPVEFEIKGDRYRYSGRYSDRLRDTGADTDICFGGNIAITQLSI